MYKYIISKRIFEGSANLLKLNKYIPTLYKRGRKKYLYDPIRKKLILKTPEELVRQKFIQFLLNEKDVPPEMIHVERPLSYFGPAEKGRADIIVYAAEGNDKTPILVVECKSMKTHLGNQALEQVYNYNEVIHSNTIAVTNGEQLIVEKRDGKSAPYQPSKELPSYPRLVSNHNIKSQGGNAPSIHKKLNSHNFNSKESIDPYRKHFHEVKARKLYPFIMNLNELLRDDRVKTPYDELYGMNIIKDIGTRTIKPYSSYGDDWSGEYRSWIIQDEKQNHHIVGLAIVNGYLISSIDGDNTIRSPYQLSLQDCVQVRGDYMRIQHNRRQYRDFQDFISEKDPRLLNTRDKNINLGVLDNSREFNWHQEDVKDFFGKIIKYALLIHQFKTRKRKSMIKRKKQKVKK